MNPERFGIYHDNIVLGIHSGKSAIIKKMQDLGFNPEKYSINEIVSDIKSYFEYNKKISNDKFIEIVNNNKLKLYQKCM